jgi:hypothetical protein
LPQATSITHGTPVTVSAAVAPESGQGTPTGDVAILTDLPLPSSQGQGVITLSGGTGSQTLNPFPGGTYQVTGQYGGDGVYGVSTSSPVTLSVTPENSNINFSITGENGVVINPALNGNTGYYGQPVFLSIQPTGASVAAGTTDGVATGAATFTLDSTTTTLPLNVAGVASWTSPNLAVGTHTASAKYSGDASFHASSASPITFTVAKGAPFINAYMNAPFSISAPVVNAGGSLTVSVEVGPFYGEAATGVSAPLGTVAPTGAATVCLGPWNFNGPCIKPNYVQTAPLVAPSGYNSQYSSAMVTFPNIAAGFYYLTVNYSGDANWQTWGLLILDPVTVGSTTTPAATKTTLAITPSSISGTQTATLSGTVTGATGARVAPTGTVTFYDSGSSSPNLEYWPLVPATTGASATFTATGLSPAYFWNNGVNQITAVYSGDTTYLPSTSNVVNLTVTQSGGDFLMMPQQPQITVPAGGASTVGVNLTPLNNFSAVVNLTCAPSSSNISCSVYPASPMVSGAVTVTLTINATAQAAGLDLPREVTQALLPVPPWLRVAGGLICALFLLGGLADEGRKRSWLLGLGLFAALWLASSCGGGASIQPPGSHSSSSSSSSADATYSVLVSGTAANGIIHNTKVIVVVQ